MKLWMIVAIELLMPGGTLLALALVVYRRRRNICQPLSIRRPVVRLQDATH